MPKFLATGPWRWDEYTVPKKLVTNRRKAKLGNNPKVITIYCNPDGSLISHILATCSVCPMLLVFLILPTPIYNLCMQLMLEGLQDKCSWVRIPLSSYLPTLSIYNPRNMTYGFPQNVWIAKFMNLGVWHSPSCKGGIFDGFFVCLRVILSLNKTQQIKCTELCHELLGITLPEQRVLIHHIQNMLSCYRKWIFIPVTTNARCQILFWASSNQCTSSFVTPSFHSPVCILLQPFPSMTILYKYPPLPTNGKWLTYIIWTLLSVASIVHNVHVTMSSSIPLPFGLQFFLCL